ncbi:MAG TPA: hypothetical protein VFE98_05755 [Candidatus Bathyarchaeia archaeon]|nr:hypothetical protein [Candidatus Bathyarchaeia archaeon]
MQVVWGNVSGSFSVTYRSTPDGEIKWDLSLTPSVSGRYGFSHAWWNVTNSYTVSDMLERFTTSYNTLNYTFSWSDIPKSFATSTNLVSGRFLLNVDLGAIQAGLTVTVDPNIASSYTPYGTSYTFQRKLFYEPNGGYYFVFYLGRSAPSDPNGPQVQYRSSSDGVNWSDPQYPQVYLSTDFSVLNFGQTIFLVYVTNADPGRHTTPIVAYRTGKISGRNISWDPEQQVYSSVFNGPNYCQLSSFCGFRFAGEAASSSGHLALSFNLHYLNITSVVQCTSIVYLMYSMSSSWRLFRADVNDKCVNGVPDEMRAAITPSDSQGRIRVVWQKSVQTSSAWTKSLFSLEYDANSKGPIETLDTSIANSPEFSVVSDSNYRVHVVWKGSNGKINSAYRGPADQTWTLEQDIFKQNANYPSITLDYSNNDVYAFGGTPSSILMKVKHSMARWTDASVLYPVTRLSSIVHLGSNVASGAGTKTNTIALLWTDTSTSSNNIFFASIPIQTSWLPYSTPADPWDGNGLAPYGQYFANLGEYVSPSNGLLTVRQTDLSVPGRGIDFIVTRVHTEPYTFIGASAYNFENYQSAPIGNGWQLNFPWMASSSSANATYIHLWDGQGYRIPTSFWIGQSGGFENHQGEHFLFSRFSDNSLTLYSKAGIVYSFDSSFAHKLVQITDTTGNNYISFNYVGNLVSVVTDTVGRTFLFCYDVNSLLNTIVQASGTCANPVGFVRKIIYRNDGHSLVSVTDPGNRVTTYSYDPAGWLLTRITFPTGWYDSYSYTAVTTSGTTGTTYRVARQLVNATSGTQVHRFDYAYVQPFGDQVTGSTITAFDGNQPARVTSYSFSVGGINWNISDGNRNFVRGFLQRFDVHGAVSSDTLLVSPTKSVTNYYQYDLWGNRIYSRVAIDPSTSLYHESFSAYYNNGLAPGFYAFQDTFSQNQGFAADNLWNVTRAGWTVNNGVYNGTVTSGSQEDMIASSDLNRPNVSIQAQVYVNRQINGTIYSWPRVGIFGHYTPAARTYKWALVLVDTGSTRYLSLMDDWTSLTIYQPCGWQTGIWYTMNMTIQGLNAWGSVASSGFSCRIAGSFDPSSPAASGTGFGLYAGGYSALFDNVRVTTVSSLITGTAFSNAFFQNGAPGQYLHGVRAGTAELQNGITSPAIESYYGYTSAGGLFQTRQLYLTTGGQQWLTTSRTYDNYGNILSFVDALGNTTYYSYSSNYQSAYLTQILQRKDPSVYVRTLYGYNFTDGTNIWTQPPWGSNVTSRYDILGRVISTTNLWTRDYTAYSYSDSLNYVNQTNEMGWKTQRSYDGLGRLSSLKRFLNGAVYSTESYTYDWMDNLASKTDALGNTYQFNYDVLGRVAKITRPDGNYTQTFYSDVSPVYVQTINENGYSKYNYFDRLGRTIASSQQGVTSRYGYDEVGNLLYVQTPNHGGTQYAYDNLNRLTTGYVFTGQSYTYDNNGNIIAIVDRNGATTTYSYDAINRITKIAYGTNSVDTYTYDATSNVLLQLQSQNATITYAYDQRGRIVSESYDINTPPPPGGSGGGGGCRPPCPARPQAPAIAAPLGSGLVSQSYTVNYAYNGEVLDSITYPDGLTVKYSYDGLGRVSSTGTPNGPTYARFSYNANDQSTGIAYGNGLVANYTYDRLSRPSQITVRNGSNQLALLGYQYDKAGSVTRVQGSVNQTIVDEQYKYDAGGISPMLPFQSPALCGGSTTVWATGCDKTI